MIILGYSGIEGVAEFKRDAYKNISLKRRQIIQGMDSSACIVKDGVIIAAAEEERFLNEKHTSKFPYSAIQFCLSEAGIALSEVDLICHNFNYDNYKYIYQKDETSRMLFNELFSLDAQRRIIKSHLNEIGDNFLFLGTDHHLSHAASAFFPSQFNEALVIVMDGMGELHSITICHGYANKLKVLMQYDLFSSLGMYYALVTEHLGFVPNEDEGKVMGLASYGDFRKYYDEFADLVRLEDDGLIDIPSLMMRGGASENQEFDSFRAVLKSKFGKPRSPTAELEPQHIDIAAALQHRTNEAVLHLCSYWQRVTGLKYCCLAGGVALNCATNSVLSKAKIFKKIYVQPAASDAGTSLGAALYHYHVTLDNGRNKQPSILNEPFYGPRMIESSIQDAISDVKDQLLVKKYEIEELCKIASSMIADNKIIAWCYGRMEFGPRALGHRSILANASCKEMRDRVNLVIKQRESFRPFAPVVKEENASTYFDMEESAIYDHMLFLTNVKAEMCHVLPAVTHIDGTARLQTVSRVKQPVFWQLLDNVEKMTGHPVVLNTSFNIKGQTMVCDAKQAINTFLSTCLDALFLDGYLLVKR